MTSYYQPHTPPADAPGITGQSADFLDWWRQGAELIGAVAFPMLSPTANTWADLQLASMPHLLKAMHVLDVQRRTLLLTMACLANPGWATWLQREFGLHYGHFCATHLGDEIFTVVVGLLASYRETPSN